MPLFAVAFLCGIVSLQQCSYLLDKAWLIIGILCILFLCFFWKYTRLLVAFILGLLWAFYFAHLQSWTFPSDLEGKLIIVTGYIASIPVVNKKQSHFLFNVEKIQYENNDVIDSKGLVRLSWHNTNFKLRVGDKWKLPVKLKKIHSTRNPGGFDYEAWSFQKGLYANGYVILKKPVEFLKTSNMLYFIDRFRQSIYENIKNHLPSSPTSHWIPALAMGERQGIESKDWEVLRNTGTNHLMAIAGLHIGFMSALIYGLTSCIWRRFSYLMLLMPTQHAASIAAFFMAIIYSVMAGFSIPTQRACIMFSTVLVFLLLRRNLLAWHAWSLALIVVLFINPLSVLTDSFWLSFISVAWIIYGMKGRLSPKGWWWKYGRIQWVIAMGLIPLSIGLFQQCSLVSFVANSIAIPCVGILVVPLTLLGCILLPISTMIGEWILLLADNILQMLWILLTYLSKFMLASWYHATSVWVLVLANIGMVLLLFPIGLPGRWFGLIWLLPFVSYKPLVPKTGDFILTLLDVGQGLSAVVQTKHHSLVFDTGAKWGDSFDMGESVVLPFLRASGIHQLDTLVISHGDNDHIGGSQSVLQQIPTKQIKSSVPFLFKKNTTYCLKGESWIWDDVYFEFIYPIRSYLGLGNNSSCVLRITNKINSVLLTGDIEKLAENYLVESDALLNADILVAPHHGSKTSGLEAFVKKVNPKVVLYPIGYRNRYHFPHHSIIEKYKNIGAISYDTVHHGAIQFYLDKNKTLTPQLYRVLHKKYWNIEKK